MPTRLILGALVSFFLALPIVGAWADVCSNDYVANLYANEDDGDQYWVDWVAAPQTRIGSDVEHWMSHLAPDYEMSDIRGMNSRHWKQPTISFELRDDQTTVGFAVNLVTNRHMLQRVETSSKTLLDTLRIPTESLDTTKPRVWCVCGDATCDSFSARTSDDSKFIGIWTRGWD